MMEFGYIAILGILSILGAYKYVKFKQAKEIKIANIVPQQRDMDMDFKYMRFLIKDECDNIEKLILNPKHRNKGDFSLIEDDIYEDAVKIACRSVLNKISPEQRRIIAFYCGQDSIDKFLCDLIMRDLRERTGKYNNVTLSKYNLYQMSQNEN